MPKKPSLELAEIRDRLNATHAEMAQALGLEAGPTVHRYETEEIQLPEETLKKARTLTVRDIPVHSMRKRKAVAQGIAFSADFLERKGRFPRPHEIPT